MRPRRGRRTGAAAESRPSGPGEAPAGPVEYDLHGLVGIRLIDASPADAAAVARQLGPIQAPLDREPDLVIRFVDRLPTSSPLRLLGLNENGFTDDAFFVLRGKHEAPARVQIPFDRIGERCEVVCERGLAAVPLLVPIVNLTALAKGVVPLHAAAFTYRGIGVLATGWAKGGKTETLLAFMNNGAQYIGDEWIYVRPEGRLHGIPEPIKVWDWHLDDLPQYRALVRRRDRARLGALELVGPLSRAASWPLVRRLAVAQAVRRAAPLLMRQRFVHVTPDRLFGREACVLSGRLDKVLLVESHDASRVVVEPLDPQEIARRMVFSLQHERAPLVDHYLQFRFAFPDRSNPLIEQAEGLQRELLSRALAGKESYVVRHPYPAPIPALFEAIEPLLAP